MRLSLTRPNWSAVSTGEVTTHTLGGLGAARAELSVNGPSATLMQDLIRSFPLFYAQSGAEWVVSDDAQRLVRELGIHGLDAGAAREFRHLSYVTEDRTLHPGVFQVPSGATVRLVDGRAAERLAVRRIGSTGANITSETEADSRFTNALSAAFTPLLEQLNGRQVLVPLSGGLDSRLLAVMLKDAGYDNVLNFTYGVGATPEASISQTVANAVGQPWLHVPYDVAAMREAWNAPETASFLADSYAGASLPHIQDWFALRHLRANNLVEPDAVVLPGHTVVGNMHDEQILDAPRASAAEIRNLIVAHHATLQKGSTRTLLNDAAFVSRVDAELTAQDYDGSPTARLLAIESWNVRERQAKYINNSMRAYEHFGYGWALPMLEEPVVQAWESLDVSVRRDRAWYGRYVARRYAATTKTELETFAPTNVKDSTRARIKSVLRTVGLLTFAERQLTARAYAAHPMGFQTFAGQASDADLRRQIMSGGSPFGLFSDLFLADQWSPSQSLFS